VLLGNFTATNLSNQLLSSVSGAAASGVSAAGIGLKISSGGAVSFDSTAFATAYAANPTAVQNLVGKIYTTLETIKTGAIGGAGSGTTAASTGAIGAQTAALQSSITSINVQVAQITKQNNDQLQLLIAEYTLAENASTAASITQSYLDIFTSTSSGS
jgi:flagellar hook-associated protein 2